MNSVQQHLAVLRDYVERSTHWREGGATRHDALKVALPALERVLTEQALPHEDPAVLEAFLKRAGFRFGWENLESQARRMVEHAVKEIAALTAAPPAQPQNEPCAWCCGTGRFADHVCRFCAGKAAGSVFAAQPPERAAQQPLVSIDPRAREGKPPCGECHLQPGAGRPARARDDVRAWHEVGRWPVSLQDKRCPDRRERAAHVWRDMAIAAGWKDTPTVRQAFCAFSIEDFAQRVALAERERWERALKQTWQAIDPLKPAGQPGSYARGYDNGFAAALEVLRGNLGA